MSNWDKVEYIKDIKITVNGGQSSSSIYGNERNSVEVIVSFNGYNDTLEDPCIDLQNTNVGPHTYLIDYATGANLHWNEIPSTKDGLFYSYSQGKYCITKSSYISLASTYEKRARITYYVYGKCRIDMRHMVGVKIILPNKEEISTMEEDEDSQNVDILNQRPIHYSASDLEPLKWTEINKSGAITQLVAFVKPKREFNAGWVDFKFEKYQKYEGPLVHVSQKNHNKLNYSYYLCPLGKLNTISSSLYPINLKYNQEPGALCLVRLESSIGNGAADHTDDGFVRLYDVHGNVGQFRFYSGDPTSPIFITLNY